MRRALILLLMLATCSLAATAAKSSQVHSLRDGTKFVVNNFTGDSRDGERPRNPLDQGGEDCASATDIFSLPYCDTGNTAGHSDDYFEECLGVTGAPDVVYRLSPSVDMVVTISLTSSSYSTYLQIYETDSDCNNLWFYDCNNGFPTSCVDGITVYSGYTYYIVVDGDWQESGSYTLNVTEGFGCVSTPCGGNGGGDTCEDALQVNSLPYCDTRNTNDYNDDYFPECNSFACGERDVVYEFSPTADAFLGISVSSTEFQPHVEIWESGTDCSGSYLLGCATVHANNNSCITGVDVYAGFTYYIYVDGHECGGNGEYTLNIYQGGGCSYVPCSGGGAGETCGDAIAITALPYSYSGTTLGMNNDYNFCSYEDGAPDIVFSYTPSTTHLADIVTCGNTQFESSIYIFRDGIEFAIFGECGIQSCYTFFGGFWQNAAMYCFEFEVGHDYCIVLDGVWSYSNGPFMLEIYETNVEFCDVGELCESSVTETEPNNSCAPFQFNVDTLFPGDTIAGTICEPGDVDYYLVVTPEDMWNLVGVDAVPGCLPGISDLGVSFVYPESCVESNPCQSCRWIHGCGPEIQAVKVAGLGDCYTGPYLLISDPQPAWIDECDPVACTTASVIECNVPLSVNTCDGCASPICQVYRDGCSGTRGYTGPQKFYRLDVPATTEYTVNVSAVDTTQDVQFSIFTDCVLPRTTCVFSQDQNYWAQNPTGPRWTETGTVSLDEGTYFLHVSQANSTCGDINVLVSCDATPCLPPDSVTIKWTTASTAEIRFISDGGTYDIYSTDFPNNDGDPRGGDPQWSLRHSANFSAGQALWTDTNVAAVYRNYVVIKSCP